MIKRESALPDADMQAVGPALRRAAMRAREIARQTNTPLVISVDGVVVEQVVSETGTLGNRFNSPQRRGERRGGD